jgi:hypothetical protein
VGVLCGAPKFELTAAHAMTTGGRSRLSRSTSACGGICTDTCTAMASRRLWGCKGGLRITAVVRGDILLESSKFVEHLVFFSNTWWLSHVQRDEASVSTDRPDPAHAPTSKVPSTLKRCPHLGIQIDTGCELALYTPSTIYLKVYSRDELRIIASHENTC